MSKLISIVLFAMWSFHLLSRLATRISQRQQEKQPFHSNNESEWEIIEPSQREDGEQVNSQLSRSEKARRVFGARVHTYASPMEKRIARSGMLALGILMVLALLILVPALIIALS